MITVVKIIVILLCLLLFILGIVLFYPVSYRLFAEKSPDVLCLKCKVFWLLGLIALQFYYPEPGSLQVKILGITVFDLNKFIKQQEEKEKKKNNKPQKSEKNNTSLVDSKDNNIATDNDMKNIPEIETEQSANIHQDYDEPKKTNIFVRAWKKCKNIWYTIRNIYDKIKSLLVDVEFYKEVLEKENTKELLKYIFRTFKKIWKSAKPKKIDANLLIGTGSPDTTGYLMAFYGFLLPHLSKRHKVNLEPDFDKSVYEGIVSIKGNITSFTILSNIILIIKDKRLWELYDIISKYYSKKSKTNNKTHAQESAG